MSAFNHPVVAVGASAGGIEALKSLVECIPGDIKATFVILQHLAPDHESQLVNILARNAKLPCEEAAEDMAVASGRIYVLPPDRYLRIVDHGLFVEEPSDPRGSRMPIDYFMRSLAETAGPQAVGVILSGTGSDGTLGLRAIKGAGGLTFAQSPETALYDGMPRAAIEGQNADRVGTITDICEGIAQFAQQNTEDLGKDFKRTDLQAVLALLKARLGYDFNPYKPGTVGRRIRRRMNLLRFADLGEYVEHLRSDDNELRQLSDDMLINVTSFFRDEPLWEEFKQKVVSPLVAGANGKPVRVWVPACSSGEEAYSLAMLFEEHCEEEKSDCDWQIFATDLDENAIAKGREGFYPTSISGDITEQRLRKYFRKEASGFRVDKKLREKVVFAQQNILSDPPFSRLDLVSCRNLLIYLDSAHQEQLIETFHFALNDNSYLILGTSESVSSNSRLFRSLEGKAHIYRRKPGRSNAQFATNGDDGPEITEITRFLDKTRKKQGDDLTEKVRRSLLSRYAPAGVVIDGHGNIQHYAGPVRRFIETPEGQPSHNIYDLLPSTLRARVRKAVRKCGKDDESRDISANVHFEDRDQTVRVDCERLSTQDHDGEPYYFITFVEIEAAQSATKPQTGEEGEEYVRQLEHELEVVREDLQTTVEELETSNEELKASHEEAMASNEELQSANEELETSREELQSLNEELVTVNHQLEDKVGQVEKTTDDLRNLLTSTRLPVLFLDQQLNISSFTETMRGLIELRDADIGRPLTDLAMKIADDKIAEDARSVLANLQPIEREVTDAEDRIYLRRVQPYRTGDERIGGVVATFTDISEKAKSARRLADRERQARIVAELGQKALLAREIGPFLEDVCASLRHALDCDYAKVLKLDSKADRFDLVAGAGWKSGLVGKTSVEAARRSQAGYTVLEDQAVLVTDFEHEKRFEAPELLADHKVLSGISTPIRVGEETWGAIGLHDRTVEKFTERDLDILSSAANIISMTLRQLTREEFLARERLSLSLAMRVADMGVWTYDPQSDAVTWDNKLRSITGLGKKPRNPELKDFLGRVHEDDHSRVEERLRQMVEDGVPFDTEFRFVRPDGQTIWLQGKGEEMIDPNGKRLMLGINADITDRKRSEEQTNFMMRELDHRVKNLLAVILSISRMTTKSADTIEEFTEAFTARVDAIARTHSLLAQSRWKGTNLRALLVEEIGTQGWEEQVEISGPEVIVSPSAAQALSMLFHELMVNAIKHGALSVPDGSIEVKWRRIDELVNTVELTWVESGGPPVAKPKTKGFGTTAIERLAGQQLESDIKVSWRKSGLKVTLSIPEKNIRPAEEEATEGRHISRSVSRDVLKGKRVLVLDDEWLIAEQQADMLEDAGATIVGPFLKLEEAMAQDIEALDLAILDFALENGNVLPLANRLNEAKVPILFVTGYGSNMKLPDRFREDLVVAKPAGTSALLDSAAWIVTRYQGAGK